MSEKTTITLRYEVLENNEISGESLAATAKEINFIAKQLAELNEDADKSAVQVNFRAPEKGSFVIVAAISAAIGVVSSGFILGMAKGFTGSDKPFEEMGLKSAEILKAAITGILNSDKKEIEDVLKSEEDEKAKTAYEKIAKSKSRLFKVYKGDKNLLSLKIDDRISKKIQPIRKDEFDKHTIPQGYFPPRRLRRISSKMAILEMPESAEYIGNFPVRLSGSARRRYEENSEFNKWLDTKYPKQDEILHSWALYVLYNDRYIKKLAEWKKANI